MNKIDLEVTTEETNQILNALAQLPYNQCFKLINKIQVQANEQLKSDTRKWDDIANQKLAEAY